MSDRQPKIALVIGVNGGSETGLAPLRYAEETARQVTSVLASPVCNFKLHDGRPLLGKDATTDAVRRAIFDARRAAGQHGTLLIYRPRAVCHRPQRPQRRILGHLQFPPRRCAR